MSYLSFVQQLYWDTNGAGHFGVWGVLLCPEARRSARKSLFVSNLEEAPI